MKPADFVLHRFAPVCCRLALLVSTVIGFAAGAAGDDAGGNTGKPTAVFEQKGLRKVGSHFTLEGEIELRRRLRDADSLKRKLHLAQRRLDACEERIDQKQQLIVDYLQQRRELRARLASARSAKVYNRLVSAMNELGDRIVLMQKDNSAQQAAEAARGALENLQSRYVEMVLQMRTLFDAVAQRYADLAADGELARAIALYNRSRSKKCRLGPSRTFTVLEKELQDMESIVLCESIDLRKGDGNLWFVPVVFNDGKTQAMAIDTGASNIALPYDVAAAVGLEPTSSDVTMQAQMADGRVITVTRKIAAKVRVGPFTVEDVECAVMPREFTQAAPLLGLSFFKHFSFKIDAANAKLIMSRVERTHEASHDRRPRTTK